MIDRARNFKDIEGQTFGRLLVLCIAGVNSNGSTVWCCLCECGNLTLVAGDRLRRRITKSCGCWKHHLVQPYNLSINVEEIHLATLIRRYRSGAERRGYTFTLTREQCQGYFKSPCYYCGVDPKQSQVLMSYPTYTYYYNGIDRLDNDLGYVEENCVPCCSFCNKAKSVHTLEEFENWIERLVQFNTVKVA